MHIKQVKSSKRIGGLRKNNKWQHDVLDFQDSICRVLGPERNWRAYLATPLVRDIDYAEQIKEWMEFENEIQEMEFQKGAKETFYRERDHKVKKIQSQYKAPCQPVRSISILCIITNSAGSLEQGFY